jgi:peptidylprolyl isomerase
MAQAKQGDRVKVHYKGSLEDGTVFDTSFDKEPMEFTLGEHMVIPGFENAIDGMNEGETSKTVIPPQEAYGDYNEKMIAVVDRSQIPPEVEIQIGMVLKVGDNESDATNVCVTELSEHTITLDGNHPLAGKSLIFEINLVEVC